MPATGDGKALAFFSLEKSAVSSIITNKDTDVFPGQATARGRFVSRADASRIPGAHASGNRLLPSTSKTPAIRRSPSGIKEHDEKKENRFRTGNRTA
jgi:hypothetical protein